jgi:hypothetical protein
MPNNQHVIEYHVFTSGFGWATLIDHDEEPVRLVPGSIIMFPQGDRQWLYGRRRLVEQSHQGHHEGKPQ